MSNRSFHAWRLDFVHLIASRFVLRQRTEVRCRRGIERQTIPFIAAGQRAAACWQKMPLAFGCIISRLPPGDSRISPQVRLLFFAALCDNWHQVAE